MFSELKENASEMQRDISGRTPGYARKPPDLLKGLQVHFQTSSRNRKEGKDYSRKWSRNRDGGPFPRDEVFSRDVSDASDVTLPTFRRRGGLCKGFQVVD